jgi:pimeloyl-ACP methyl ester carboxylesterase
MNSNDKDGARLAENRDVNAENHPNLVRWLDELERFSCYQLTFHNFPPSLIIQGFDDMVVHVSHSKIFQEKIANSQLEIIKDCGHVPHQRYLNELRDKILDFIK